MSLRLMIVRCQGRVSRYFLCCEVGFRATRALEFEAPGERGPN
jgi:hypothetical protein